MSTNNALIYEIRQGYSCTFVFMIYKSFIIFIFGALFPALLVAQKANSEEKYLANNKLMAGFSYGYGFPLADMSERFGSHFAAGASVDVVLAKSRSLLSAEFNYVFGNSVKEDVLSSIRSSQGFVLGISGGYATIALRERATYLGLLYSKIISENKTPRGLKLGIGAGIFQHKIRIQVDSRDVPILEGSYVKGFDRNSIGPAVKQVIAYHHIGKNRNLNYSLQMEILEGFTKSNRTLNFETMQPDDQSRFDVLVNFSAKWYLPVKDLKKANEIYY